MNIFLLFATLSLLIQVIVLILLITSYTFKRKQKFRHHGILMLSAVILHASMILTIMVPSFSVIAFTPTGPPIATVLTAIVHATFGTTTLVLGAWIVGSWRLRTSLQFCSPKKKFMRATFILWLTAISIGIILYFALYLPLMTG
jgi:uncharacterized membrane protein YozB (DUF420 family)